MTDPASPAAVTEERIAEIRRKLPASFDQELAHETDKVLNYVQELRAAYDARGLELARVREERDVAIAHELEQRQAALDAEARLARANEAKEAAENELLAAGMANIGMRRALMACADLMTDINPDDDNEAFWKDWDAAIKDARAKSTPTPPAQSAGEALDPAGTGEVTDAWSSDGLTGEVKQAYDDLHGFLIGCPLSDERAHEIGNLIRAQASALAEARRALALDKTEKRAMKDGAEVSTSAHARHNLEGALIDLQRGRNDEVVQRTIHRVIEQLAAVEDAL